MLYLWCKEGWQRSVLGEYHTQKQALSRFFVGAMLQTEPVLDVIRRELPRVSPTGGSTPRLDSPSADRRSHQRDVLDGR